jgi:hypothetical protein
MRENPYVGAGGVQGWTEHRYFPGSPQAVSGSWWEALWGGPGERLLPLARTQPWVHLRSRVGYRRGSNSVEPACQFWRSFPPTSAWVVNAGYPPAHPGSGPWWESPWGWGQGRGRYPGKPRLRPDNLPERTDRALIVCSLTGIKTVSRGGGLLTVE